MTKDEALKLALQLVSNLRTHSWTVADEQLVITAIKQALAQPEPVIDKSAAVRIATALGWEPKRKPLTDEEIILIVADCASSYQHTDIHFARAIEAAHGIKELEMNFVKWFRSEPHRDKYESDHPAFLAAREAWDASRKEALAQSEQEPVAWMDGYRNIYSLEEKAAGCEDAVIPLVPATLQHWSDCSVHNEPAYPSGKCDCGGYTTPPHRKPLTDEEIHEVRNGFGYQPVGLVAFARAIEAKLKEKNT